MRRAFAGMLDPSGNHHQRAAEAALRDEGAVNSFAAGGLTVAFGGGPAGIEDGRLCLLAGDVYEVAGPGLPALFEEPGAALSSLRGDFSILGWDPTVRRGLLARDQFGGQGVYWWESSGKVVFATEVHLLLRMLERRPPPHRAALAHWLAAEGIPGDQTMYEGVFRVPPAGMVTLGQGRPRPQLYWDPAYEPPLEASREELASELRTALERSTRRCLRSPDPVGVMLSGGLDSSSVAALAVEVGTADHAPWGAYSAVFPNHPSVDEGHLIDALTQDLGLPSKRIVVRSGSVLAGALAFIERWELPPVSPNLFFWFPLFERAARDGIRTMLDGEGGDEIFGASPYYVADLVRRGRVLHAWRMIHQMPGAAPRPPKGSARRLMRRYGLKGASPHVMHRAAWRLRPHHYAPRWLHEDMARLYAESGDFASWKRTRGPRWWSFLRFLTLENPALGVAYDQIRQRAAVSGIAPRHPLKDVELVELTLKLPPEASYDPVFSRPMLREAMAGLLIDELRLRPTKSSFDAVFQDSLAANLQTARSLLTASDAEVRAFVDVDAVDELELRPGPPASHLERQWWSVRLWRLLTAECWLRFQSTGGLPQQLIEVARKSRADYEFADVQAGAARAGSSPDTA